MTVDLTEGFHVFPQTVNVHGNHMFKIAVADGDGNVEWHRLAGHEGMSEADALAAFVEARDGPSPEKRAVLDAAAFERRKMRDLTKVEFEYLLAFTGLDDVWAALEAALKEADRALFAAIRSQRVQDKFRLANTLGFIGQVRDLAASVAPDADLSDDTISAAWADVATREL